MKYLKIYESFITEAKKDNNILYNLSNKGEKVLILLPGAGKDGGQGKDDFKSLAKSLGKDFSVFTADFKNEFDVRDYAKKIVTEIEANDDIKQCAVGGFSIGGAIAWHLAMALKGGFHSAPNWDKYHNLYTKKHDKINRSITDNIIEAFTEKGNRRSKSTIVNEIIKKLK